MDLSTLLKNEEVQKQIRSLTGSVGSMVYNEIYLYVWFICIYNILLFFIVVINLYFLIRLMRANCETDKDEYGV